VNNHGFVGSLKSRDPWALSTLTVNVVPPPVIVTTPSIYKEPLNWAVTRTRLPVINAPCLFVVKAAFDPIKEIPNGFLFVYDITPSYPVP
jgi:hypothetical protein